MYKRQAQGPERPVVLKLIAQSLLLSIDPREAKAMFEQESRLSPFVIDANVVNIFDTGCWEGTHYIAMEYLRGVNLSSVIKQLHRKGLRCPFPLAAALVSRACLGLHAAHEARDETGEPLGIVHRDFTPTNIMCTPDGEVKLIDFGVARALGKRSLVSRGQFVGCLLYTSLRYRDRSHRQRPDGGVARVSALSGGGSSADAQYLSLIHI